jgi:DMSO/TMAO reductase YedYZ heme-binding membrane subunit
MMTWATATASVVLGLLVSTRAVRNRTGPWFLDLHRFLGGISVVFLAAHVVTLWADSYVDFGPRELFVPGASEWRPEAIAWGIIAAYFMVAVELTSLVRRHMSQLVWRAVHLTSFVVMGAGSYHAWTAGSDVTNPVTWAIAGIGCMLVFFLVSIRLQRQDPDESGSGGSILDNRQILEEMRLRLEALPVPESLSQPQLAPETTPSLPRRAPVADDLPGIDRHDETDPGLPSRNPFEHDPFAADPHHGDDHGVGDHELGDGADPAPADSFTDTGLVTSPRHWPEDGADLFDDLSSDPFEALRALIDDERPNEPAPPPAPPAPPAPAVDPFASASLADPPDLFSSTAAAEPVDLSTSPFNPVDPPPAAITEPEPDAEGPATAAPEGFGPPPLPVDAVNPDTGEPDQEAYTAWLRDWLAYAERYGDETPEDPSRVE